MDARIYPLEFAIVSKLKNDKKKSTGKCNGCKWIHAEDDA